MQELMLLANLNIFVSVMSFRLCQFGKHPIKIIISQQKFTAGYSIQRYFSAAKVFKVFSLLEINKKKHQITQIPHLSEFYSSESLSQIITRLQTNGGSIQTLTVRNNNNVGADLGDLPATIDPCQPTSPTYPDPPINIPNPPFSAISMRERGTKQRSVIWSCRCTSRSEGKFTNTTLVDFFCKE